MKKITPALFVIILVISNLLGFHYMYSKHIRLNKMIQKLQDRDSDVRYEAARALGKIEDDRAVKALVSALKDENLKVRVRASIALVGAKKNSCAIEPLIHALKDEDPFVRGVVAQALGKVGDVSAINPLITALKDEDSDVRAFAAWALGSIGDVGAVSPLSRALKDENSGVREQAALALGMIRHPYGIIPLIDALKDEGARVKSYATWALQEITGKDFGEDTEKWQQWCEQNDDTSEPKNVRDETRAQD